MRDQHSRQLYEELGVRFLFTSEPYEVVPSFLLAGEVLHTTTFEPPSHRFFVENERGVFTPDLLKENMSLAVQTPSALVVITVCAHSGIVNILLQVRCLTRERYIHAVVGGLHLVGASEQRLKSTTSMMNDFGLATLVPCLCTGNAAVTYLKEHFDGEVRQAVAGAEFVF